MLHVNIVAAEIPPLGPNSDTQCSYSYCKTLSCTRKWVTVNIGKRPEKYLTNKGLYPLMNKL